MPLRNFAWMATPPFVPRMLSAQVRMDLLAKEAETGFTYTYVWMADQLGHFALGFIPTYAISWIAIALGCGWSTGAALVLATVGCCIAAGKEAMDVRRSEEDSRNGSFPELYDRQAVILNAITASGYMIGGLLVALAAAYGASAGLAALLLALLAAILPARYWLRLRYVFQQSGTPYVRRIWSFTGSFGSSEDRQAVAGFLAGKVQHLVLTGPRGTGKTTLAVALATELAATSRYVRFLSWFDLNELSSGSAEAPVQAGAILWRWPLCEVSVVDDVLLSRDSVLTQGSPVNALHAASSQQFLDILRKQKTVWVLPGDPGESDALVEELRVLLATTGEALKVVALTQPLDPDTSPKMRGKQP